MRLDLYPFRRLPSEPSLVLDAVRCLVEDDRCLVKRGMPAGKRLTTHRFLPPPASYMLSGTLSPRE